MNILFLNIFRPTEDASGGIARVTRNLNRIFTENGHRCSLAYFIGMIEKETGEYYESVKLEQGNEYELLSRLAVDTDVVIIQIQMTKKYLYLLPILDRLKREYGIRLVYCHHSVPFAEAAGLDFHYLKWILFHSKGKLKTALWCATCILFPRFCTRRIAARRQVVSDVVDKVVLLSESFIPEYLKYVDTDRNKLACIGNCFTYTNGGYDETLKENTILVVSNMTEQAKRISTILKAWKQIKSMDGTENWKLQLVGNGEDFEEYRRIAARLKLTGCSFEGRQNPLPYYRKSKMLLMASAFEGFGMVILEAQQMGCVPVVCNSTSSVHDIIDNGKNGMIISPQLLAGTVYGLMRDDARRQEIAGQCPSMNGKFSERTIYSKWENLFKHLGNDE